jgi:tRNA threonylcarbamoyladenosine biosynthesis protein TsaE
MTKRVFYTATEEETVELGRQLAAELPRPGVVLLIGSLGAGKTTLAKGLSHGAAAPEDVTSPTFPLVHEYGEAGEVIHIDLYRLDTLEEVRTLGLDEIFTRPALVLLEWAERFPSLLPAARVEIRLEALPDETRRVEVAELP